MSFEPKCIYCTQTIWMPMESPPNYALIDQMIQSRILMNECSKSIARSERNLRGFVPKDEMLRRDGMPSSLVSMSNPLPPENPMSNQASADKSEKSLSCCEWIKYPFVQLLGCLRKIACAIWGLCGQKEE